ncbi:MAG: hypothetical protein K0B02_03290 [DPANN group archaeon]|nr:hypothetical protein [DPANN group archaeon]
MTYNLFDLFRKKKVNTEQDTLESLNKTSCENIDENQNKRENEVKDIKQLTSEIDIIINTLEKDLNEKKDINKINKMDIKEINQKELKTIENKNTDKELKTKLNDKPKTDNIKIIKKTPQQSSEIKNTKKTKKNIISVLFKEKK